MAFTEKIEDETLKEKWREEVSNQIADFLPGTRRQLSSELVDVQSSEYSKISELDKAQLGESFKIWEVDIKRLIREDSGDALEHLTKDTGRWHHQVFFNDAARGHAESCLGYNDKVHVGSLSVSPLAGKIDRAIDFIDKSPDHVRFIAVLPFLNVPSFSLFAFWLIESKKVYILDAPASFIGLTPGPGAFLLEADFVRLLRNYCRSEASESKRP